MTATLARLLAPGVSHIPFGQIKKFAGGTFGQMVKLILPVVELLHPPP